MDRASDRPDPPKRPKLDDKDEKIQEREIVEKLKAKFLSRFAYASAFWQVMTTKLYRVRASLMDPKDPIQPFLARCFTLAVNSQAVLNEFNVRVQHYDSNTPLSPRYLDTLAQDEDLRKELAEIIEPTIPGEVPHLTRSYFHRIDNRLMENISKLVDAWPEWQKKLEQPNALRKEKETIRTLMVDYLLNVSTSDSNRQLNIEEPALKLILTIADPSELAEKIQDRVTKGDIDFPWKRYTMGNVHSLFDNLVHKDWNPKDIRREKFDLPGIRFSTRNFFPTTYQGPGDTSARYFAYASPPNDYKYIDIITDYFQERARLSARKKKSNLSPLQWWAKPGNVRHLTQKVLATNPRGLLAYGLREAVFESVGECTQFKVTLVKEVIETLKGTRFLDISAGWGDRLVGAIGTPSIQRYVATDPNTDLKAGHDEIKRTLAPGREDNFTVIYEPFQTAQLPPGETFDLVFTSPPYFDFEIYTQLPGQSVADYPKFDAWFVHFLLVSLYKAWGVLDIGGHLAIHITDTHGSIVCEPMNLFIQSRMEGSVYEGVLASFGARDKARPIWVFRKEAHLTEAQQQRKITADSEARKYFKSLWESIDKVFPPVNLPVFPPVDLPESSTMEFEPVATSSMNTDPSAPSDGA